jgi:hypothetical protein
MALKLHHHLLFVRFSIFLCPSTGVYGGLSPRISRTQLELVSGPLARHKTDVVNFALWLKVEIMILL